MLFRSIGDIVIAMSSGSKRLVGKSARAKTNFIGSFGAFCGVFRPDMAMNSRYTAFFFESPEYRNTISEASSGSNINNLRREHILEMPFPLPPLEEQRRIVAKLESLFSKLEVGVLALQRARGLLKRYRQSLLRDAVEGKLSAEWRAKQTNLEPASALLERVLRERRAAWEARELARLRAKGTEPLGDAWKARYEEPSAVEVSSLPELPEGWGVIGLEQATTVITSGSRDWTKFYGRGTGTFLMAQNVRPGRLDLTFQQRVDPPLQNRDRLRSQVECHDLLVTIVGANTGDVCRVTEELAETFVCQSVALMRPVLTAMSAFMEMYLLSFDNGQRQFREYIYGAGRPHLSFDQLKSVAIHLPPLEEQLFIVAELERRFELLDSLESTLESELKRAAQLRQSALHRAFTGQLVPQDERDEHASVLLERIRAARAAAPAKRGRNAVQTQPLPDPSSPAKPARGRPRKAKKQEELF